MNKDFIDFQKYFKEYQQRFGLMGYRVYFKHEPLNDAFSQLRVDQNEMVAIVSLESKLPDKDKPFKDIKRSAKHEAIHLLVMRLQHKAMCRYLAEEEIFEANEELVRRLEELIPE